MSKNDSVYAEVVNNYSQWPVYDAGKVPALPKDHFVQQNGIKFAGVHLILDFWSAQQLDNITFMEQTLRRAVHAAKATLLHIHLHHFTPNGGISGVAILAESHISVHTWPERGFAAFDIFMCGDAQPHAAVEVLRQAFKPGSLQMVEHQRGRVEENQ